jgi:hypothetical protein
MLHGNHYHIVANDVQFYAMSELQMMFLTAVLSGHEDVADGVGRHATHATQLIPDGRRTNPAATAASFFGQWLKPLE